MWTSLFSGTREEHNGREVTLQIEEKWEREAVIMGREDKENEGDRECMKWGGGVRPSLPPDIHQNCTNTAPRSLTKTGPWPSILAKGTHARALPGTFSCLFLGISYFHCDTLKWMRPQRTLEGVQIYFGRLGTRFVPGYLRVTSR